MNTPHIRKSWTPEGAIVLELFDDVVRERAELRYNSDPIAQYLRPVPARVKVVVREVVQRIVLPRGTPKVEVERVWQNMKLLREVQKETA